MPAPSSRTGFASTFIFIPWPSRTHSSETHIAKVDDWGDYLYIVFHVAGFEPEPTRSTCTSSTSSSGKNYLITYHTAPLPILDQDRRASSATPAIACAMAPTICFIRFLELAIDQSLAAIEHLDEQVDRHPERRHRKRQPQNRCGRSSGSSARRSAAQDALAPARGLEPPGPRSLSSRSSPSTASIFATSTITWCGFTISPKACAT